MKIDFSYEFTPEEVGTLAAKYVRLIGAVLDSINSETEVTTPSDVTNIIADILDATPVPTPSAVR